MDIVLVKHSANGKSYWFEVPMWALEKVKPGSIVICDTCKGKQKAIVVSELTTDKDAGYTPARAIVAVERKSKYFKVEDVMVPWSFRKTRPRKEKLISRINEYYDHGSFDTEIVVDQDGVLRDGYTAWMIAKMLGLKYLKSSM